MSDSRGIEDALSLGSELPYLDSFEVVDLLTSLVEKSVVIFEPDERGGGRYRLLQTVRAFGNERLVDSGEDQMIRDRHLRTLESIVTDISKAIDRAGQEAAMLEFDGWIDDIRAAYEWDRLSPNAAGESLRMSFNLMRWFQVRGHITEGIRLMGASQERWEQVRPKDEVAKAVGAQAVLTWLSGDLDAALALLFKARDLYREIGDDLRYAAMTSNASAVLQTKTDYDRAYPLAMESLEILRRLNNSASIGGTLINIAVIAYRRNDLNDALAHNNEAIERMRDAQNLHGLAVALNNLGMVFRKLGELRRSADAHRESLEIREQIQDRVGLAWSFEAISKFAVVAGNPEAGAMLAGSAAHIRKQVSAPLHPGDAIEHEEVMRTMEDLLGVSRVSELVAQGMDMTMEETLALARQVLQG